MAAKPTTNYSTNRMSSQNQSIDSGSLKTIADYFNLVLRYAAAGFTTFSLALFVDPELVAYLRSSFENNYILLFTFSCIIGVFIYSVHQSALDRWYYKRAISRYIRFNDPPFTEIDSMDINESWKACQKYRRLEIAYHRLFYRRTLDPLATGKAKLMKVKTSDSGGGSQNTALADLNELTEIILFKLYTESFKRNHLNPPSPYSKGLNDRYAILAFMYCTAYGAFAVCVIFTILHPFPFASMLGEVKRGAKLGTEALDVLSNCANLLDGVHLRIVVLIALVLFIIRLTRKLGYRLVRREMWIISQAQRNVPINYSSTIY